MIESYKEAIAAGAMNACALATATDEAIAHHVTLIDDSTPWIALLLLADLDEAAGQAIGDTNSRIPGQYARLTRAASNARHSIHERWKSNR